MPPYRIYELDRDGHSSQLPISATCKDDEEAMLMAHDVLDERVLEIWCGPRKVATIKPDV